MHRFFLESRAQDKLEVKGISSSTSLQRTLDVFVSPGHAFAIFRTCTSVAAQSFARTREGYTGAKHEDYTLCTVEDVLQFDFNNAHAHLSQFAALPGSFCAATGKAADMRILRRWLRGLALKSQNKMKEAEEAWQKHKRLSDPGRSSIKSGAVIRKRASECRMQLLALQECQRAVECARSQGKDAEAGAGCPD